MTGFTFGLRGLLQTTRFALDASKNSFHIATAMPAKVAVILSGCGMYDGSECHEVSAVLVHLSRSNAEYSIFAPDKPQMDVIDHIKGKPMEGEKRNVMVESARLARGKISALSELDSSDFDAVVFPGGFGAAKNLSTFAVDSSHCMVIPEVEHVIKDFHSDKKPIGVACISPVLVAKTLSGVTVTVGSDQEEGGRWPYASTAAEIVKMGARHIKKNVTEAYVDPTNNVVSSPAFMCNAKMHEVHDGIGEMIRAVLGLIKK